MFREKYEGVVDLIGISEDFILPSEVLDGRVGHGKVVALLSYAIADELGITSEEMKLKILQAGFLADVGLQEVPRHLLNRSKGGLSSDEYEEYMGHCVESTRILRRNGYKDDQLLEMIHHSHEKYDGNGFPDGLRGEKIPIGARIIAVADTYNTLTSWHPQRERWNIEVAFDELQSEARKGYFDMEVVQALIRVLDNG